MAIVLLAVALVTTATFLVLNVLDLDEAQTRIDKQDDEIEMQKELIEKKETFRAAMGSLLGTASTFDGVLLGTVVDQSSFEILAARGWAHRWDSAGMATAIDLVDEAEGELRLALDAASVESSTNATGSTYEAVIDQLSGGYVTSLLEAADEYCGEDVIGCVGSEAPDVVHFDTGDDALPYMTDWLRTGIAYHEFAHVLQFTNPEPTDIALESFGGDAETMADCYALTFLDGWTLDHTIWLNRYEYWEVSLGYGLTCDDTQRQAIRDWHDALGVTIGPVSQL